MKNATQQCGYCPVPPQSRRHISTHLSHKQERNKTDMARKTVNPESLIGFAKKVFASGIRIRTV